MGARLIVDALAQIDNLTPEVQPEAGVTYATKIDKAEACIDWSRPAAELVHHINGLSPFPGAWVAIGDERVKLLHAALADGNGPAGCVLHDFTIACSTGALEVLQAQRPGKRPMPADDILRGLVMPGALD
jgi:methionyl-tRNA formyltransferase